MTNNAECACGSNKKYDNCCGLYIDGGQKSPNPESLMRSRYTAYTMAKIDYIQSTMKGVALATFDENVSKDWAKNSEWLGLKIIKAEPPQETDTVGYVDFVAKYKENGTLTSLHEISEFNKIDGVWYYMDGKVNPRYGRNDPCFCGSGLKHKKCCG